MSDTYFAALPDNEIGKALMERIDAFYKALRSSGLYGKMLKSWRAYYGRSYNGSVANSHGIEFGGDQGELSFMKVNHYRNLAQHMLTLTTSQRPAPLPIASNTDNKSHAQVVLATGLLDYYSREKRVERVLRAAAEMSIITSDGFVTTEWDANLGGEFIKDESGASIREGDLRFAALSSVDVPRDLDVASFSELNWMFTRSFVDKNELIAKFPLMAEKINAASGGPNRDMRFSLRATRENEDSVAVYSFWHKKTAAVPGGKLVTLCGEDCVLFSGDLPYDDIPVRRIAPGELIGAPVGYTPMFDLLALQEALDALYSAVLTNQTTFGVQNIWVPESSNLSYESLATGLNLIKTSGTQKPEALNLTNTPAEIFNFIKQIEEVMETLSGINSTVRGNPEASLKSGSALALVQSQAIQFSSGLQASYAQLVEDVFTDTINILKVYAKTKRVALIVGKYNQHMLKEFTGSDLDTISRVVVESGGSLSKTTSGKMQMAQDLLQNQMVRTPEEYMSVINTGKLEPMTEGQTRQLFLIRQENERLAEGIPCKAMPTDNHILHIKENSTVLDNPEIRAAAEEGDPTAMAVLDAAYQHLLGHMGYAADPMLANLITALGYAPIAPPLPPETAAGGTPAGGGVTQLPEEPAVSQPVMPQNPATGEQWNPQDGGGMIES